MDKIFVQPVAVSTDITFVKMAINNFALKAHDCEVSVWFYSDHDKLLDFKTVYVPPSIYETWLADDDHIIQYVLDQLGLTERTDLTIDV